MPPVTARTVGGPGAGKTYRALQIVEMLLERIIRDPLQIGFVSFTRAARRTASERAGAQFSLKGSDLEKHGWFRTLHSVAYRCLGIGKGELLTGTAGDNVWLRGAIDVDDARLPASDPDEDYLVVPDTGTQANRILAMWDTARNRQVPLEGIWLREQAVSSRLPDLDDCHTVVDLYEAAKAKDDRLDFTDLLMRFSGRRFSGQHDAPFLDVEPQGDFPVLPAWLHDEAQDMSELTRLAFERLTRFSQFSYLLGDNWQSIYSFAGSDGSIFARWSVAKEEILPVSYRCRSKILAAANALMHRHEKPRPFTARYDGGEVHEDHLEQVLANLKPTDDVLILGRTNEYARAAAAILDENLLPWSPLKGGGTHAAPARAVGVKCLLDLAAGREVDGTAIWRMLALIPSRAGSETLFEHGSKAWFDDVRNRDRLLPVGLGMLGECGATEAFRNAVASGTYLDLLEPPARKMAKIAQRHGVDSIGKPTLRVGTAHGSKGMEADHVVAIDRIPYPTKKAILEEDGLEEERRVWFVTKSRARHKLTMAYAGGDQFPES